MRSLVIGLFLAVLFHAPSVFAQADHPFLPFIGTYEGQTVFASDAGLSKRDLTVVIRREDKGFSVEWTTETQKSSGKTKSKKHIIAFAPSGRPGIYQPIGKIDRFGQSVPLEPLKGDPQVWARIAGKTLSVYATVITDDGGVEMQTYDRKLIPGGMELIFTRVRNGRQLKDITAKLEIQDPAKAAPYPECIKTGDCPPPKR